MSSFTDRPKFIDSMVQRLSRLRSFEESLGIHGYGVAILFDEFGRVKQRVAFGNLVTQVGDQYYGERASGIGSPPAQVTGMKLGTDTGTAVAKTGAGAAIVTYVSGVTASKAIDGSFPTSSLSGSSRRIQWKTTWNAGEATKTASPGWGEVVISNETALADDAGTAANTISRALLSPVILKGANDSLAITWNHDLLGA
jgi:hypothetical protein